MDKQNRSSVSYRSQPAGTYRGRAQQAKADQLQKSKAAEKDKAAVKAEKKLQKKLAKMERREKRASKRAERGGKGLIWKILGAVLGIILVAVILLMIFGDRSEVYHQMPKVTPPEAVEETV